MSFWKRWGYDPFIGITSQLNLQPLPSFEGLQVFRVQEGLQRCIVASFLTIATLLPFFDGPNDEIHCPQELVMEALPAVREAL